MIRLCVFQPADSCHKKAAPRKPFRWAREAVLQQNDVKYLLLGAGVVS